MRKLVTLRTVNNITHIEGADKIVSASIDGWNCIVKANEFKIGDVGVFFEVDSLIPLTDEFAFLKDKARKNHGGITFNDLRIRIKTIRLKGVLSQGLLLPLSLFKDRIDFSAYDFESDLTEAFNVLKYEPKVLARLRGNAKGLFPSFIFKTDQERCLSGETLITTNLGEKTIKEIVDNKLNIKVLSYNHDKNVLEFKNVLNWSAIRNNNDWLKITLKSGKVLICTDNHRIWADDISAYRQARDLMVGQKIIIKTE